MSLPLTILGGYLGAGKTTIINRLLSGKHGKRLTVLVNDFGAINIDADLIAEFVEITQWFTLFERVFIDIRGAQENVVKQPRPALAVVKGCKPFERLFEHIVAHRVAQQV